MSTISVIIPLFNGETTICLALDSVRRQTRLDQIKEIVVVDDGSQDDSYRVVEKYAQLHQDLPIILLRKENGGASSARNLGIRYSTGSFIAFLDADDIWLPEKTEIQLQLFHENPDMDFLGCAYSEKPIYIHMKKITSLYKASLKDILWRSFPCTPSVMMKRQIVDHIGYFDETQKFCEDMNYFQKICAEYHYYYLPNKLVEIGMGKKYQWEKGLISNVKEMYRGAAKNLRELYEEKRISRRYYFLMALFLEAKYVRRRVIVFYMKRIKKRR